MSKVFVYGTLLVDEVVQVTFHCLLPLCQFA